MKTFKDEMSYYQFIDWLIEHGGVIFPETSEPIYCYVRIHNNEYYSKILVCDSYDETCVSTYHDGKKIASIYSHGTDDATILDILGDSIGDFFESLYENYNPTNISFFFDLIPEAFFNELITK